MLTDEQVAIAKRCGDSHDINNCNECPHLEETWCQEDLISALLSDRAELVAEEERLQQLSIDLHACMVEARHKLGLEQDKNDELRAVAQEVLSYTDYIRPLGPRGQVLRNAALAALDEEVGSE
jgi:hypothetical protein